MKTFLKILLALTLITAFLLTGCDAPNALTENILSDEEALSTLEVLLNKSSELYEYVIEVAEFGPYNIDGLELFEKDGLVYAEYVFSNFSGYQEETHEKSWDEKTYGFSSIEEINNHITSIFLTEEDANYSDVITHIFKEKNNKLFYNTAEESPAPRPTPDFETVKIIEKKEDRIIFSGECHPYITVPTSFSMVKNSEGEWRLTKDVYLG